MRPRSALVLLGLGACLLACRPKPDASTSVTPEPEQPVEVQPDPLIPEQPANREPGETLELTIPLLGAETLELASLRGRPVVLEISASWEQGWRETHALYAELIQRHPELAVIVVAAEPEDRALLELPEGLTRAWDPAGALAARLSVAIFPTVIVLDRRGAIVAILNGFDDELLAALAQAIDEALVEPAAE